MMSRRLSAQAYRRCWPARVPAAQDAAALPEAAQQAAAPA
jgi:hypothetical protein